MRCYPIVPKCSTMVLIGRLSQLLLKALPMDLPTRTASIHDDCRVEEDAFKWIESEKVGHDLGDNAIRRWVQVHWWGYLRARWLEHLQGTCFWVELDRGDFGLLPRMFVEHGKLLSEIIDKLKAGQENLDVINWALDNRISMDTVRDILEKLDINSRRLAHRFDL